MGEPNVIVAPTGTDALAVVYPAADAVMFAEPRFTPVTVGCVAAGVAPALIVTLADEIVTFVRCRRLSGSPSQHCCRSGQGHGKCRGGPSPSDVLAGSPTIPGSWSVL